MYLIDSHCHLNLLEYQNLPNGIKDILKKANNVNIKSILTISTSIKDYKKNFKLFHKYPNILYSCGIHPLCNDIKEINNISKLETIISKNDHIIALGETGLDYYHPSHNQNIQKKMFQKHIEISIKFNKPIIIHTRNAEKDTLNILSNSEFISCKGVIHSFTNSISIAKKLLDLGFYISISGIVTFKNAYDIKKVVQFIPIDRLLIETDSPYLTPVPYRGQKNQPSNLLIIAQYISKLKKIDLCTLSNYTTNNFNKLFNLIKPLTSQKLHFKI